MVFYTRPDRPPPWAPPADRTYPVRVVTRVALGDRLLARVTSDAAEGRTVSVVVFEVGVSQYQAVVLLEYAYCLAIHLESVPGAVENLTKKRDNDLTEPL